MYDIGIHLNETENVPLVGTNYHDFLKHSFLRIPPDLPETPLNGKRSGDIDAVTKNI